MKKKRIVSMALATVIVSSTMYTTVEAVTILNSNGQVIQGTRPNRYQDYTSKFKESRVQQPATWNDVRLKIRDTTGKDLDNPNSLIHILLKGSENKGPLIPTKDEVSQLFSTLVRSEASEELQSNARTRLDSTVRSLSPSRNYLLNRDLEYLFDRIDSFEVQDGILTESVVLRLIDLRETTATVDIITKGGIIREYLDVRGKGKINEINSVYEVNVEENRIVSVGNKVQTNLDIVESSFNHFEVNGKQIPKDIMGIRDGDLIEYIEDGEDIILITNYGKSNSYVVKSVDRFDIDTLEKEYFDIDDYYIVDERGIEIKPTSIKKYDIIDVFKDRIVVTNKTEKKDINQQGGRIYIGNEVYNTKDMWVISNNNTYELDEYKHMEHIHEADVHYDIMGNPIAISIKDVERTGKVIDTKNRDGEVKISIDGSTETIEESRSLRTTLRRGYIYNFIIVEDEIVDADRLSSFKLTTDWLDRDYIRRNRSSNRRDRYYIDEDVTVAVKDKENKDEYNYTNYESLYENYRDEIEDGDMELEVFYEGDEVKYIEVEYYKIEREDKDKEPKSETGILTASNHIVQNKLGVYGLSDYNIVEDGMEVTLKDEYGNNAVLLIKSNKEIMETAVNSKGRYVQAVFDNRGVKLQSIKKFPINKVNIQTEGINKIIKLDTWETPEAGYELGSESLKEYMKDPNNEVYELNKEKGTFSKLTKEKVGKFYSLETIAGGYVPRVININK